MIFSKFISKKRLSQQLKKPSGWMGKYIIPKLLNQSSYQLNSFTLELLHIEKNDKLLEIGFGTGLLIHRIAKELKEGHIDGIDFSQTMYNKAFKINKKHIQQKRVNIHLLECKDLPFNPETFNKICSVNTLYFWKDPEVYFKDILRVLRTKGHFILGFRDKEQMNILEPDKEIFRLYEQEEIIEMLYKSGFTTVTLKERKDSPLTSYCIDAIK